jgi:hypothetical protein
MAAFNLHASPLQVQDRVEKQAVAEVGLLVALARCPSAPA